MDSLVALRFKINESKMLDFVETRKETTAYIVDYVQNLGTPRQEKKNAPYCSTI
jgi:hypothetical protein